MSDGPHRSLPMRRGWKRVAECADNRNFDADEISGAIIPALEQDCNGELSPEFVDGLCGLCRDQERSLFKDEIAPSLERLRETAGAGIGRVVLDYAFQASASGKTGIDIPVSAMESALKDRAARGSRQVEEHYCRKSTQPRANKVRERIDRAIGGAAIGQLARKVLKLESSRSSRPSLKRQGIDDGVKL